MRYKLIIFALFLFYLTRCNNTYESINQSNLNTFDDSVKHKILSNAFNNHSSSPDFVVFTLLDLNTNKSKEICCESDLLFEAFINENVYSKRSDSLTDIYDKTVKKWESIISSASDTLIFSFKSSKSLEDLGYYEFQNDSLKWYTNNQTFALIDTINKKYKPGKAELLMHYTKNRSIYLIHVLNKNGVFCGRDCVSGHIVIRNVIKK